jgi:hypothetical protein
MWWTLGRRCKEHHIYPSILRSYRLELQCSYHHTQSTCFVHASCTLHLAPTSTHLSVLCPCWCTGESSQLLWQCLLQIHTHTLHIVTYVLIANIQECVVAISFGLTCKHLNLQCMSIPIHLRCLTTISASPTHQTCLEIITLVLPMSSPVPLNPTGAYLVVTHYWLSWQHYYMYSHRPQYLMACYILLDPKFWYLLLPIYSRFSCS